MGGESEGSGDGERGDEQARSLAAELRAVRPGRVDVEALAPALEEVLAAAAAAWPGVVVPRGRFLGFLVDRLPAGPEAAAALAGLCVGDLYLACGCADGEPRALAAFDRQFLGVVERAVIGRGASAAESADLQQVVRERLLMARASTPGQPPRIAEYSGRGSLRAWVRVVATREALRLLARPRREVPTDDDELAGHLAPAAEPELGYLKELYREEFKRAFREAVAGLSDRERVLLRQHALDGLSIDRLADFYGVHRATTARWVDAARRSVLDRTRRALGQRLHVPSAELDSIMRLIHSRLDVTLPSLLRGAVASDDGPARRRG
jgi:RNA polymerase sigma-70 factor, ECF subfamily